MDLSNLSLIDLQTEMMKEDPTTIAMCEALNPQFKQLDQEVKLLFIYSRINDLDEKTLDELAWQTSIDWYDTTADIEIKRKLVKSAIKIHKTIGTPYAVETLIETYFGDGYVQEWFEYGGDPYMFKVVTSNSAVTAELANQFIKVLNKSKNTRSHLEQILITLSNEMNLYFAGLVHTADKLEIRQVI